MLFICRSVTIIIIPYCIICGVQGTEGSHVCRGMGLFSLVGVVQPGEEKALGRPYCGLSVLKGAL